MRLTIKELTQIVYDQYWQFWGGPVSESFIGTVVAAEVAAEKAAVKKPKPGQCTFQMSDEELSAFQMAIPSINHNKLRFEALKRQIRFIAERVDVLLGGKSQMLVDELKAIKTRLEALENHWHYTHPQCNTSVPVLSKEKGSH